MSEQARVLFLELLNAGIELAADGDRLLIRGKGLRQPELIERARRNKNALLALFKPQPDTIIHVAAEIFQAEVDPIDKPSHTEQPAQPEIDNDLPERLELAERLLAKRDHKGRIAYTRSEVDSYIIGIRHRTGNPDADSMLARLNEARKRAVRYQELSGR